MNENKIRIVIADDHPLLLQGQVTILSAKGNFEIVGQANDGELSLALIRKLKPDVAILDVQMPGITGFKVAQTVISELPETKIIFLTMFNEEEFVQKAVNLGVRGYILKENAIQDLVHCIEAVSDGRMYFSPQVSEILLQKKDRKNSNESSVLTPAELKILHLIGEDKSSKEIADELFLSIKTVGNHRNNICKKLGITGNSALLKYALKQRSEREMDKGTD